MKRFLPVALIFCAACTTTTSTNMTAADPRPAIAQANVDFAGAARRGDAAGVANFYANDAVMMPPNMPAARGRDAIRQVWSGLLGSGKVDLTLTTDNVIQSCDLATEVGHYDFAITPNAAGAATQRDSGKYAVTWRNDGGQWRIVADIFNSNAPPPPTR